MIMHFNVTKTVPELFKCYIQKEMINQLEQKVINVEQQNNEVLMVAKAKREHQRTPESTFAAC